MLSRSIKIFLLIVFFVVLITFAFQVWWMFIGPGKGLITNSRNRVNQNPSWSPSLVEYRVEEMSPKFQELWIRSSTYIVEDFGRECKLFAFDNKLVFEASFAQNSPRTLNRANLETREIIWQKDLDSKGTHVMAHNKNTVFFGFGTTGKIIAFDLESGEQIWENSLSTWGKNIIDYMHATETELYVNSSSKGIQVFDSQTGQPYDWQTAHVTPPVFHVKNDIAYQQNNGFNLRAVNLKTEDILWEQNFDEPILMPPIFIEEMAFVKTGHTNVGIVYAIDLTNGEILWKNPHGKTNWANQKNVLGTIAEDNGYLFYFI